MLGIIPSPPFPFYCRSWLQVVLPSPSYSLGPHDVVLVVRRMQCHYNPVWLDGKGRHHLGDLPRAFTDFFFSGVLSGVDLLNDTPKDPVDRCWYWLCRIRTDTNPYDTKTLAVGTEGIFKYPSVFSASQNRITGACKPV